jgi:anti-sigma factor ChrR (cupin superfamily)
MLNMDFSLPLTLETGQMDWVASPKPGVWRKPLAREEAERGHATSIVRYDPGASFHGHNHPGGEEILVLEGCFSDATGDFQAGTYFRNPAGFVHAPFSKEGCVILVKLHQFQPGDQQRLAIETHKAAWETLQPGVQRLPLHRYGSEQVAMLRLAAGMQAPLPAAEGLELYLLEGCLADGARRYPAGSWLRRPRGSHCELQACADSLLWFKSGHLG